MNNDITLLILAAGMGSRFGGLKQIAPMGPNDEFIIDYSVYDAIKAGFNKVVFLIKEENYEIFKETIGSRVEPYIKVEYCFQKNDNIPSGYEIPESRVKPLGTAHAMLCCKDKIHEPFMIINADDFYGRDAFIKGAEFLKNAKNNEYGIITYLLKNTITESGSVKRGVCEASGDKLIKITESKVEKVNGNIVVSPLNGDESFIAPEDEIVSMNMLLFTPTILQYIEDKFPEFLENNKDNIDTCEYLIPYVLLDAIDEGFATTKVIPTTATWYGVTYKEDTDNVRSSLKELIQKGEYPNNLWKNKE